VRSEEERENENEILTHACFQGFFFFFFSLFFGLLMG
jgi:hypothetical protein